MPILSRNAVQAWVLVALVGLARPAAADPVLITSGSVETHILNGLANVFIEAQDFRLRVGLDAFRAALAVECVPCAPGSTVSFGGTFNSPRGSGSAFVDGVAYPRIFVDGMTGTFTTPSTQVTGTSTTTLSAPFFFSGTVNGYLIDPFTEGPSDPVFTKAFVGSGTAAARFIYADVEGGPFFTATDLRYDFGDAAAVPEPSTFLLGAVGATILAARRRRARRQRVPNGRPLVLGAVVVVEELRRRRDQRRWRD